METNAREEEVAGPLKSFPPAHLLSEPTSGLVEEPVGLVGTKHDEAEVPVRVEPFI